MMIRLPAIVRLVIFSVILGAVGCSALPGGQVTDAALVVHTAGSRHDTLSVTVPTDAQTVYASFAGVIEDHPEVEIISRKDSAMMMEVRENEYEVTAQVTPFGEGKSLLYIWADAGESGRTGRDLSMAVVEAICEELGVPFEVVQY